MADNFNCVVDAILRKAESECQPEGGDYYKDDLLYCGKCHTPRQGYVKWVDGEKRIVPIQCECRIAAYKAEEDRRKLMEKLDVVTAIRKDSLMDDKFSSSTFDTVKATKDNVRNIKLCHRYAEIFDDMYTRNQGLLMYGPVGTGKTYLASCIGNAVMDMARPVLCTSITMLLKRHQANTSPDFEDDLLRKIRMVDLLILDDLGAERDTPYATEFVYSIIDARYRAKKPMIVTTNLDMQYMQNCADVRFSRIYDRVFETCLPVEFTGVSWRKREAAHRFQDVKNLLEV